MLTQARLKELLSYDPETGVFTWRVNKGRAKAGTKAGTPQGEGYLAVKIDGRNYLAHRLVWLHVHGVWPTNDIDHDDRDRSNNRIINLRDVTRKQNLENSGLRITNTSGYKGVSFVRISSKWRAAIMHNRNPITLGLFDTPEEASEAYQAARDRFFTHHKKEG